MNGPGGKGGPGAPADAGAEGGGGPSPFLRHLLMALGWAMVALGVLGLFLPVLPTAPFLIVAAWAFSRSSRRFHDWLHHHPRLGPPLRAWQSHGVIPVRGKVAAVVGMWSSLGLVLAFAPGGWVLPAVHATIITAVTAFILTRPSRAPA